MPALRQVRATLVLACVAGPAMAQAPSHSIADRTRPCPSYRAIVEVRFNSPDTQRWSAYVCPDGRSWAEAHELEQPGRLEPGALEDLRRLVAALPPGIRQRELRERGVAGAELFLRTNPQAGRVYDPDQDQLYEVSFASPGPEARQVQVIAQRLRDTFESRWAAHVGPAPPPPPPPPPR
ncbi:MAG: hypothetical protein KJ067_07780 [Vicinamibacteria bacterium]|nr:hypothetical protein [Vicinamibacteria bacterium]